MNYVIQDDKGWYVSRPRPNGASYTEKLQYARMYDTRQAAERDCCGNERVLTIEEAMRQSL